MYRSDAGKMERTAKGGIRAKGEKRERRAAGGWRSRGTETNDPVSRCAEVIKSRQIFSLSRRVSDTYIILKGLFRGHYRGEKRAPKRTSELRSGRIAELACVRARIKPGHFSTLRLRVRVASFFSAALHHPFSVPSVIYSRRFSRKALALRALTRNALFIREREREEQRERHVPRDRVVDPRVIPHRGSFIAGPRGASVKLMGNFTTGN
jgi:hypothetical protein